MTVLAENPVVVPTQIEKRMGTTVPFEAAGLFCRTHSEGAEIPSTDLLLVAEKLRRPTRIIVSTIST